MEIEISLSAIKGLLFCQEAIQEIETELQCRLVVLNTTGFHFFLLQTFCNLTMWQKCSNTKLLGSSNFAVFFPGPFIIHPTEL